MAFADQRVGSGIGGKTHMRARNASAFPPRTNLTFRVGVVGHRPNRLPKDQPTLDVLRETVAIILDEARAAVETCQQDAHLAALYAPSPFAMRAVSPLAEGADRIMADEAIKLGYGLCCPMPFFQSEFEKDFDAASTAEFRGLLDRAGAETNLVRFELDGRRNTEDEPDNEARAYANAGQVVLNQSDLLILIWDGGASAGVGGTADTLERALRYHVPTIWIDARKPRLWQCLRSAADMDTLKTTGNEREPQGEEAPDAEALRREIAEVVRAIVKSELGLPPKQTPLQGHNRQHPPTHSDVEAYFGERKPLLNLAFGWKLFRNVVSPEWPPLPAIYVRDFVRQVRRDWPVAAEDMGKGRKDPPPRLAAWVNSRLRGHYAWADKLADLYGDGYRSTYILSYLFSALAVFIALLPMAAGLTGIADRWCIAGEFGILVLVLLVVSWSLKRHWHDRWMDYRLLAELIRQVRFLVPVGGGRPFPHIPDHLAVYGDPTQSWMYWHMRGVIRDTNLPDTAVTQDYIRECLGHMAALVGTETSGQLEFHNRTRTRSENIHNRLEWGAIGLVVLTVVAAGCHFGLAYIHVLPKTIWPLSEAMESVIDRWLILASATLPALGAALAGINNQGEFVRLAKRSTAMVDGLGKISGLIKALQAETGQLRSESVVRLSRQMGEIMIQEVVDWRVMVADRPPPAA